MSKNENIEQDDDRQPLSLGSVLTSEGFAGQDRQYEEAADKALLERPLFSIRSRIILAFSLFFLVPLIITYLAIHVLADVQDKTILWEVLDNYVLIFIGLLVLVMILLEIFLARGILATLGRFISYTHRISQGDFTPITPVRRFRDEFSDLAVMINRMVRELDRHHRILMESHKLRAMGTLVAGVAHELNNPLNNIMLTASILKDEQDSLTKQEQQEMYDDVISQSERSKKIIGNLLDYARESEAQVQSLDLRQILDETIQLVGNNMKMKKIHLVMDLHDDLPSIHGDKQLLCQVFTNIMLNAIDVLEEKGEIRISSSTERREGYLAVDISDNGPGIAEHIISQIFDPFFTTKPQGKGTGLGLSVSRGIVRKLGGYLLVESQLGEGTTFTVLLSITTVPSQILVSKGE
jgi:signal transduction histidine kinase